MNSQYGSFEIQSPVMKNLLQQIQQQKGKKFFIVVGDPGTGKTVMLNYLNRYFFENRQKNIFDDSLQFPAQMETALISTSKENAYEVIKHFDRQQTYIVEMPVLAERKGDIAAFAAFFIEVLSLMDNKKPYKLTEKAVEKLLHYNWPGNFHELEAVLEKAFHQASQDSLKNAVEPEHIELNLQSKALEFSIGQKLDEVERKYILQTLYFVHQNRTRAAEILGISIRTLRNKINQYREEGYL